MAWPAKRTSSWRDRQRLAGGDADLQLDQVEAGDELGDGVLDLQARVHLQEVEGAVGTEQELDRAGVDVADGLGGGDGGRAHARAQLGIDGGRGRLLQHLLVAALHRAVALAEMDDVAVRVGEDLDLDVAGAHHGLLQDQLARAEGVLRLGARRGERGGAGPSWRRRGACRVRRRRPRP